MFGSKQFLMAGVASLTTLGAASGPAGAHDPGFPRLRPVVIVRPEPVVVVVTSHGHVARMAHRLEREARDLLRETDLHFRSSLRYRVFESEVREMGRMAYHIHEVADGGGSIRHLRHDVTRLDRLYHSAERLFDEMAATCRLDRATVLHVRSSLTRLERTIHHLRADLD